ncbi:hypothetical protein D910_08755 [Dendroctonus ponderosae]
MWIVLVEIVERNAFNYYYITEIKRGENYVDNAACQHVISFTTILLIVLMYLLR